MESYTDKIKLNIEDFGRKIAELIPPQPPTSEDLVENQSPASSSSLPVELNLIKVELFLQDADISAIEIVKLLCYSLLSGEYVCLENLKENLNVVENSVKNFIKDSDYLPGSVQKKIFEYSSCVTIVIEAYKIFIQNISNNYSKDRINFIFSENNHFEDVIKESDLSEKLDSICDYFILLLEVTFTDHFPSNENSYVTRLFAFENKITALKVQEYNELTKVITIKIKFLQHKWKERNVSDNPNSHIYLSDGDVRVVENFKNDENLKLKEWLKIIETQYELISKTWMYILEDRVKSFRELDLDKLKILEIHQLIKYYKDVKPNYEKLIEISNHLINREVVNPNIYNNYSKIISINYSLNNKFSLFLQQNKDLDKIKKEYLKVKSKIAGGVYNFF